VSGLRPFFSYYGGKWRAAPKYPAPRHGLIIEPFAGSAGYATRHHARNVLLVDADPIIAGLWQYLINVRASEIRGLPLAVEATDTLAVAEEARWLIGFWLNKGASSPRKHPSAWMRSGIRPNCFWGEVVRDRIAWQVEQIRHWRVFRDTYSSLDEITATWFVDPPYQRAGKHYRCNVVSYAQLAYWCRHRPGQVIACEADGADWLPFQTLASIKATAGRGRSGRSAEVIWTNDAHATAEAA
jgi:16S rRNA G966 N2-methylase RsmD